MRIDRHQFSALDSWRGLCACLVALAHFDVNNHIFDLRPFWNAGYYVDFFFVLSGFVIFANYQTRLEQGFGIAKFMLIRLGRVYPLQLATLGLFIAHELLQLLIPAGSSFAKLQPFSGPGEGSWEIVMNVLLLTSLDTVKVYSFNSPSWSISAEAWTYLLFAALLTKAAGRQTLWMGVICAGGFIWFEWFGGKFTTHDWGFFRCVYGFAAGGLCWQAWLETKDRVRPYLKKWATLLESLALLGVLALVSAPDENIFVGLTPFVFAALVYIYAFEQGAASRLLTQKPFLLLGALSYSIYMLHAFISWKIVNVGVDIVQHYTGQVLTVVIDGQRRFGLARWQGDLATPVYLLLVILASVISYRWFEMPCRDYFKRKADLWFLPKS